MVNVLHLGLSYACNMKCNHCYVEKHCDGLSESNAKSILKCLYEQGLFIVYYTFGEPLLVPYLLDIVTYGKKLGLVQVLMTNGYYLSKDIALKLKIAGITNICVSIDSIFPEKHNCNRGVSNAFEMAISAINNSIEIGIKTGIGCTVTQDNMQELESIENMAHQLGVNYVSFLRERHNNMLRMGDFSSYYSYAEDCFKFPNKHRNVLFHDISLNPIIHKLKNNQLISEEHAEKLCEMNSCHTPYTLSIAPNGDVSHCNLCFYVIGNIKTENLYTILNRKDNINENIICFTEFS